MSKSPSRFTQLTVLIGALAVLGGCAGSAPPPDPVGPESAALGVKMKMKTPVAIVSHEPEAVLFARLDEGQDLLDVKTLFISNLAANGQAYLLNVEPGTYVVVAAVYGMEGTPTSVSSEPMQIGGGVSVSVGTELISGDSTHRNYCSRELIEQTRTTVAAGSFAFMGKFEVGASGGMGEPDECQRYFKHMIEGERSSVSKMMSGDYSHRLSPGKQDRSDASRREFFDQAKKSLGKTGWVLAIDRESQ